MSELKKMTEQLQVELEQLKLRYEKGEKPESKNDKQFFLAMKEKTTPIYNLLEEWESAALQATKQRIIKVHPQQINSTKENVEMIILHSYYVDERRKRYMELNHSCSYIFNQLLNELRERSSS
ncbi:DUF1798 family protein [Virgibacillus sp. W0181]|uniref:DUF1798 family protein n=1 Tax=Virgibacillus sp. W0181 TaxID=3391581 RepID=UPI003F473DDB